jgi:hypothetical protein
MTMGLLDIHLLWRGRVGVRQSNVFGKRQGMSLRRKFQRLRLFIRCWMGSEMQPGQDLILGNGSPTEKLRGIAQAVNSRILMLSN